jgi:hypothetical protein
MPITTTPSGGPQGEFSTNTPIYSTTLSATTTSVTFSNIPTTFTDLVLVVNGSFSGTDYLNLQFNGDTTTSYSDLPFRGNGSSASAGAASSRAFIWTNTEASANSRFMCRSNIQNYSNPNINKSVLSRSDSTTGYVAVNVGTWRKTEPITSIRVYALSGNNFNIGTTFTIYGIKAAAPAPKATGGDVITTDGTYWYHAFKTTGVFSLTSSVSSLTADVLQIAGGGGGGSNRGGGGGAGGLRIFTSQALTINNYVIAVGAGGSGGGGTSGNASQFHNFTVSPGGGRGGNSQGAGLTGASGGGGGNELPQNPTPAGGGATLGNVGGTCDPSNKLTTGGGGGGFGGAGQNGSSTTGGTGGAGVNTYSSWANATGTGVSGFYAGGGGGYGSTSSGTGGSGGGGRGGAGNSNGGSSATANTGSGGGATDDTGVAYNGGSGVVIVRYPV